jgi:hypothetical protein
MKSSQHDASSVETIARHSEYSRIGQTMHCVLTSVVNLRPPLLVPEASQRTRANMPIVHHRVWWKLLALCTSIERAAAMWCRKIGSGNVECPAQRSRCVRWGGLGGLAGSIIPRTAHLCTLSPIPHHSHTTPIHRSPPLHSCSISCPFAKASVPSRTYLNI